jgi:hypothetical protein
MDNEEIINCSGVPTLRLASNLWYADVTVKSAQCGYEKNKKTAYIHTRLAVKEITIFLKRKTS